MNIRQIQIYLREKDPVATALLAATRDMQKSEEERGLAMAAFNRIESLEIAMFNIRDGIRQINALTETLACKGKE